MSILRDSFVKEKPFFTGISRGLGGFGFGGSGGGGAAAGPLSFTIKRYNTSNVLQSTTPYSDVTPGTVYTHATAGYYTLEIEPDSPDVTFQMWAWGGAGGTGGPPGTGAGGAGGGVRGTSTFSGGDTITFLVGGGGAYETTTDAIATSFPDGGNSVPSYNEGPGGGRSSIYDGLLPYANRDATPNVFLLIGGGGGGGTHYVEDGTYGASAGYPSGNPGGGYYGPEEPADTVGKGATQSAGGAGGAAGRQPAGDAGSKYQGGDGQGGAGGGGYYGGGGAGGYYSMGGGGSGYIHPSLSNTASFSASPGAPGHRIAVDDPANPGIKPVPAGYSGYGGITNGGEDGAIMFKVI